jgi:hypothetical protein
MDGETLLLARYLAFPEIGAHYRNWFEHPSLKERLNESSRLILTGLQETEASGRSGDATPEAVNRRSNRLLDAVLTLRAKRKDPGSIATASLCKSLDQVCALALRLADSGPEAAGKTEQEIRAWIEKTIVTSVAYAEPRSPGSTSAPNFGAGAWGGNDPWQSAVEELEKLRRTPVLTGGNKEEEVAFPLSSYALHIKPKVPTGIETFDMVELEGGAEEDTTLILSGETNIGKSHLGLFGLSSLSLRREAVLLCSGEDSLETTRKRIFAHYLRMPASQVIAMSEKDRLDAFRVLYGHEEDTKSLHHHIVHHVAVACMSEGEFTPTKVAERIDMAEQKMGRKIRAFMADYLQKMGEGQEGAKVKNRQRDEELERVVNQLRDICQARKCFGTIISQVPSNAAGGAQEFLGLKQAVARSYAATWGAHYVITMNRTLEETRRLASAVTDKRPRLNLFLCKNKDGPLGVCHALGFPAEARWEFYRDKASMEREIEARKLSETRR